MRLRGRRRSADYAIHTSDWRLDGYREALAAAGMICRASMWRSRRTAGEPPSLAHRLLDLPEPPTAIFAASDNQAVGVLKAARERGLSMPKDLAVMGFDDVDIADYIGLTTIHQPLEESGRVAVDLLLARLIDPSRPPQRTRLPVRLVRRRLPEGRFSQKGGM